MEFITDKTLPFILDEEDADDLLKAETALIRLRLAIQHVQDENQLLRRQADAQQVEIDHWKQRAMNAENALTGLVATIATPLRTANMVLEKANALAE